MRIWSLHPQYLDAKGLVALWRETLLAQAVLLGRTRGYTRHPQLDRFRTAGSPSAMVADYLRVVAAEAARRGYHFDVSRIAEATSDARLPVTSGQMQCEWQHLLAKLALRDPPRHAQQKSIRTPLPHPLFDVVPGDVEPWEKASPLPVSAGLRRTAKKSSENPQ
ncbi:pyrimidine dimer DNA glycosylase/endonuclease V [Dokdonella ginsengisoli]|uniref:Pyrimidine dimer DNA glycosylase/endonuclease V n=1 Tax=Dokdonella ginsengisoli TaxID=363846 RepID=A0ABV9R0S2_9GAMM